MTKNASFARQKFLDTIPFYPTFRLMKKGAKHANALSIMSESNEVLRQWNGYIGDRWTLKRPMEPGIENQLTIKWIDHRKTKLKVEVISIFEPVSCKQYCFFFKFLKELT